MGILARTRIVGPIRPCTRTGHAAIKIMLELHLIINLGRLFGTARILRDLNLLGLEIRRQTKGLGHILLMGRLLVLAHSLSTPDRSRADIGLLLFRSRRRHGCIHCASTVTMDNNFGCGRRRCRSVRIREPDPIHMLTDISHFLTYSISFRATIGVIALGCFGRWFPAMDSVHATRVSGDKLLGHHPYWCF